MKNCPRVQKLWICLKVSLQTLAPKISAEVDGGQMECHVCTDMGAMTPIGIIRNITKKFAHANGVLAHHLHTLIPPSA